MEGGEQCDQIRQFIGLWATFQSLGPQLICPSLVYSKAIFLKVIKSLIVIGKYFWATFIDVWQFFTCHTEGEYKII